MKEISVKALAKVNLGLDVVRKREDGYHEVRMIMQTIHLFDRLEIMRNQSGRITMSTNLAFLPTNENNLVYKAAALLKEEFDIGDGIDVKLHKCTDGGNTLGRTRSGSGGKFFCGSGGRKG